MAAIEGQLVQVKKKSSEGNLRYPSMLDDQYDTLRAFSDGDGAPTKAQLDTHALLEKRLAEQLVKWRALSAKDVPALNALVKHAEIPDVRVTGTTP
jgi:hypothetical protein